MVSTLSTGRTIKLAFVHSSHDFETREGSGALRQALDADARNMGRRLTLCEVSQVGFSGSTESAESEKSYATLGQGVAVCHPKDVFSKAGGRKGSLGKALLAAGLNHDERSEIWAAYRKQFENA